LCLGWGYYGSVHTEMSSVQQTFPTKLRTQLLRKARRGMTAMTMGGAIAKPAFKTGQTDKTGVVETGIRWQGNRSNKNNGDFNPSKKKR